MSAIKDLRGQRFGSRTVYAAAPSRHGKARWKVRCDCGALSEVFGFLLRKGQANNCNVCAMAERRSKAIRKAAALPGREIIGPSEVKRTGTGIYAQVRCGCGFVSDVRLSVLRKGGAQSCISCANSTYRKKRTSSKFNAESCNV